MLPAPTTIATCTPWSRTAATWRATAATRSGSVPNSSDPINASPESFKRIRLKAGAEAIKAESLPSLEEPVGRGSRAARTQGAWRARGTRATEDAAARRAHGLLTDGESNEPANDHVLAGGRGELVAQLLHGLTVELGVVHLLLEQHDRLEPGVELAGDDFLAHVLGLVGGFLLVDLGLCGAHVLGDVIAADVGDGRGGGDLQGDVARELDEVLVVGDEVGVAVDLDQHADARAGVDVGLHGALGGLALAEILDLLALLHAQDLDRPVDVALGLGEGFLAVHHARAGALAQRLDVLGCDLGRAHCCSASLAGSSAGALSSVVSGTATGSAAGSAGVSLPPCADASASMAGGASAAAASGVSGVSASGGADASDASASGVSASLSAAVSGGADCGLAGWRASGPALMGVTDSAPGSSVAGSAGVGGTGVVSATGCCAAAAAAAFSAAAFSPAARSAAAFSSASLAACSSASRLACSSASRLARASASALARSSASLRAFSSSARNTEWPSCTTCPIACVISAQERMASSLPGIT